MNALPVGPSLRFGPGYVQPRISRAGVIGKVLSVGAPLRAAIR